VKCKHGIEKWKGCSECNKEWGWVEHDHDDEVPVYSEEIEIDMSEDDEVVE